MVANKVCHMPIATTLAIALFSSKTFISHHFNEDGEVPMEFFKGEKLDQMLLNQILALIIRFIN